jgi:hypothetical protein
MPNPALDPKNKIVAIYNKQRTDNSLPTIEGDDYTISLPEVYVGPRSPSNTRVKLTPKVESLNYGDIRVYYDRIDLSTLSGFSVVKGTATTVLGLLAKINEELGVEMTATDIEEAALGVAVNFNLTASPQNLIFIGSTVIGLT